MVGQIRGEIERKGAGDLADLLHAGDVWTVHEDRSISRAGH